MGKEFPDGQWDSEPDKFDAYDNGERWVSPAEKLEELEKKVAYLESRDSKVRNALLGFCVLFFLTGIGLLIFWVLTTKSENSIEQIKQRLDRLERGHRPALELKV